MPRQRLLNCDFVEDSKFKVELPNKAKLLYFYMFANADDRGFVGKTLELIKMLNDNDQDSGSFELAPYNYENALYDLIQKGFIYEFKNSHGGKTHLIRHWYYHNHIYKKAFTNYGQYLKLVVLRNNEYVMKNDQLEVVETEEEDTQDWDKMIKALDNGN